MFRPRVPFKICNTPGLGRELVTERVTKPRKTKIPPSGEGGGPRGGGVLGISSDGDDRMEPKVKTQKNP